jgi:hypothetical protein
MGSEQRKVRYKLKIKNMYITTDIGNYTQEQVKYLVSNKVLVYVNGDFLIPNILIDSSEFKRKIHTYGLFCHCLDWVKETTGAKKMREQVQYLADNNIDIVAKGKTLVVEALSRQKRGGKERSNIDFE